MRLIGLTGGIATGKSTVAAMLAARGAVVVDADRLAREVVMPGTPGHAAVVDRFGPAVLDAGGAIDRAGLAARVFADPVERAALESITHPRIRDLMGTRILTALSSPAPLVVADIPLLFEGRRQTDFDGVLLVYAPADEQVRRLRQRDGFTDTEARVRLAAQMPIAEKAALATWLIDNSDGVEATSAQVDDWWRENVVDLGAG